jgi:hypothetical protein
MFNLVEDIKSISYEKSHTAEVMRQVEEKNKSRVEINEPWRLFGQKMPAMSF